MKIKSISLENMTVRKWSHMSTAVSFLGIFILLLTACASPNPNSVTIFLGTPDSNVNNSQNIKYPTPYIKPVERTAIYLDLDWRIRSYECNVEGNVIYVVLELIPVGGKPPYWIEYSSTVSSNQTSAPQPTQTVEKPSEPLHQQDPTDTPKANPSSTPVPNPTKTSTVPPTPTPYSPPIQIDDRVAIRITSGITNIFIQSSDGQVHSVSIFVPSKCEEINVTSPLPTNTPKGIYISIDTPRPPTPIPSPSPTLLPPSRTECNDGIDNDGDGYIDFYDPQCKSAQDNHEDK